VTRSDEPSHAPPGLRRAAAHTALVATPIGEGTARVGAATVRWEGSRLACDCPMGDAPACLHRLVASGDARRIVESTEIERAHAAKAPERASGEPRLPKEDVARFAPILSEVDALVAETTALGLRRAARALGDRVRALSARAASMRARARAPREAGLARLASTLDRLSTLLSALEGPDAGTAEAGALAALAVTRNLSRALRANTGALPLEDMAGSAHREYVEVPPIEVQGLGLEAWVTAGGIAGVTAYVAVLGEGRVLTRTTLTKGKPAAPMDPRTWAEALAAGPAFARSSITMRDLARGRFALSGAKIAPSYGRLSGSSATSAASRPALPCEDPRLALHVLAGPKDAARHGQSLVFDPLGRPPRAWPIALLPVSSLAPSDFDPATQALTLRMRVGRGAKLRTSLAFRDERALWFDNLEVLSRAARPPRWLSVRLGREGGELVIEPISALSQDAGWLDLTLDVLDPSMDVGGSAPHFGAANVSAIDHEARARVAEQLARQARAAIEELAAVGASGFTTSRATTFRRLSAGARSIGLFDLAEKLEEVATRIGVGTTSVDPPSPGLADALLASYDRVEALSSALSRASLLRAFGADDDEGTP